MNTIGYIILAVGLIAIVIILIRQAKNGVTQVNVSKANDLLKEKELLILDVRSDEEFKAGHLKGARNIPVQSLTLKVASLLEWKDKSVLVYCHSGGRSLAGSQILKRSGFSKIYNLAGGISAWVGSGNKVVK